MALFTVMAFACFFKVKRKFLRSTSLTVDLLGRLPASYIPPDHVSQCSGCDMAHPQHAHTHFGKKGRGRGDVWGKGGGGITRYEDGGGDWVSCPIFSALFLPLQLMYARVCAYVLTRAYSTCMTGMWPAAVGLHFKTFTKPMEAAKQRAWWEQSWEKKINQKPPCLGSSKGSRTSL